MNCHANYRNSWTAQFFSTKPKEKLANFFDIYSINSIHNICRNSLVKIITVYILHILYLNSQVYVNNDDFNDYIEKN